MKYTKKTSVVYVVGVIWMPAITCAQTLTLSDYDIRNAQDENGAVTRESLEQWLTSHTGNFRSVTDFSASLEVGDDTVEIPWATEEGELAYLDATCNE